MAEPRPLPLFAWLDRQRQLRAQAARRTRQRAIWTIPIVALAAGIAATIAIRPTPRLVWNASASAPLGLYRVTPDGPLRRGDYALVRLPRAARDLAARRHYLPANVPAVKRVAGIAGDRICARGATVVVGRAAPVARRASDPHGRPLPRWTGCVVLAPGTLFLLAPTIPDAFDGRYFGPVERGNVIGKATLLWAR